MGVQYRCKHEKRRAELNRQGDLIGIDYLEVSDDQHQLSIHFVPKNGRQVETILSDSELGISNIKIVGGVRITNIHVKKVELFKDAISGELVLNVYVDDDNPHDGVGDFSTYSLQLIDVKAEVGGKEVNPLDPLLSQIDFSFKVNCSSEFDCKNNEICPPGKRKEINIDYLSKDYASFRRLIIDRLSLLVPDWKERSPADLGMAIVEVLAYAADYLSYYQDAVATEAYLGTARKRVSVRRHARLLDYPMHDGCNSRVWVAIRASNGADGRTVPGPSESGPGIRLLTRVNALSGKTVLEEKDFDKAVDAGALVFETMHDLKLFSVRNRICFYTWGEEQCCLPKGATQATLKRRNEDGVLQEKHLKKGDVLIIEEEKGIAGANPDPSHRHAVRLTEVRFLKDPLFSEEIVEIKWSPEDALPFPLCISKVVDGEVVSDISIALGNVVLADHGCTFGHEKENMEEVLSSDGLCHPLRRGPLTHQGYESSQSSRDRIKQFDIEGPASKAMQWEIRNVLPAIKLVEKRDEVLIWHKGLVWLPQRDLLNSGRFTREFVVEMEEDGTADIRFGDGIHGMRPSSTLNAIYRVGNGLIGNVGANTVVHILSNIKDIECICNPMPARGGRDPEPIDQVRLYAPQAFRIQERAVTEEDYAAAAQRHLEVQKAVATLHWTGSWYTMFISVDRKGGKPVDQEFMEDLLGFLERFRLAGIDLRIERPEFVSLDIALTVCVSSSYFQSDVKKALLDEFSNRNLSDGRRGFFHPDNFTFNQSVYSSQVLARAMEVPGVLWVDISESGGNRFQRWGEPSRGEIKEGKIEIGRLEIARLDNDPNNPENGRIEFLMEGGQ